MQSIITNSAAETEKFAQELAGKLKGNDVLAFRNPDGETVVFCMNREAAERGVRLVCGDKMMILNLQPKTFNTIIY